ncbi:hypothetical protein BQ8482_110222 [Mesorhizobium delmotii]|uniref:Uncharacterized protein n=1 Tax=Mesorhizobium delmotii TaxID=1631247 RepID=A0A2P9AAZ0_9HYPH|nr:hypothetical protein BQ8482_110222 [Mesorhizobium delmotii]
MRSKASSNFGSAGRLGRRVDDDLSRIVEFHGENVFGLHASRVDGVEQQCVCLDLLAQFRNLVLMLFDLAFYRRRQTAFRARGVGKEHDIDFVELGCLAHGADVFTRPVDRRGDFAGFHSGVGLFLADLRADDLVLGLRAFKALRIQRRLGSARREKRSCGNHMQPSGVGEGGNRHRSLSEPLSRLVSRLKSRNVFRHAKVPSRMRQADLVPARHSVSSARFLGDQGQRAIGIHAGGDHLRRGESFGFERGFDLGRRVDRAAQFLQPVLAALGDHFVDLRLRFLRQFLDVDDVDGLNRRHFRLSRLSAGRRGSGRSRRLAGLRRRLLLGAGSGREQEGGGGRETYHFAHGSSFPSIGERSFWGDPATSNVKWDRKVSLSGSLRDHRMATMWGRASTGCVLGRISGAIADG